MSRRALYAPLLAFMLLLGACSGDKSAKPGDTGPFSRSVEPTTPAAGRGMGNIRALDAVDAQTVFAIGKAAQPGENLVLKSVDGGATWAVVLRVAAKDAAGAPVSDLLSVDFLDASNGVVMDEDGATYATADGGATWTAAFGGQMTRRYPTKATEDDYVPEFSGVGATSSREGWAVGIQQVDATASGKTSQSSTIPVIYRTTDGGTTWKGVTVEAGDVAASLRRAVFASPQTGWAVGGDPEIGDDGEKDVLFRSKDGGKSWQRVPVKTGLVLTDVAFVDANHGFLVGATDEEATETSIFETKDGGATWQPIAKAPTALYALRFANAEKAWAVGAQWTVLGTSDGGATWSEVKLADVSTGGVPIQRPPQTGASDDEQTAFFYGIALVEPKHGWVATDEGIFEYRGK